MGFLLGYYAVLRLMWKVVALVNNLRLQPKFKMTSPLLLEQKGLVGLELITNMSEFG